MSDQRSRPKIKICGITNLEDARFISGALVDYLGFIFYEKSPRFIEPAQAGAIINWLEGPEKVGVFVNQSLDEVNQIARQTGIDYVQLHGNETPEYCSLIEKPVIKAIHIEKEMPEYLLKHQIEQFADVTDYLLFDTKTDELWGGTGQSFDWSILNDVIPEKPFFLSGGLNASNIQKAIETVNPAAVDISSSLESEPGIKDYDKVEELMEIMNEIGIKD